MCFEHIHSLTHSVPPSAHGSPVSSLVVSLLLLSHFSNLDCTSHRKRVVSIFLGYTYDRKCVVSVFLGLNSPINMVNPSFIDFSCLDFSPLRMNWASFLTQFICWAPGLVLFRGIVNSATVSMAVQTSLWHTDFGLQVHTMEWHRWMTQRS